MTIIANVASVVQGIAGTLRGALIPLCLQMVPAGLYSQQIEFPRLTGPYFGQSAPGSTMERFLPSVFVRNHSTPVFSPDGNEVYWESHDQIHMMGQLNDIWTPPRHLKFFADSRTEGVPFLSFDGKRLYFNATLPGSENRQLSFVDRTENGWSSPSSVGSQINSRLGHWQFSVAADGTIYFPENDQGNNPGHIMVSRLVEGEYEEPSRILENIRAVTPFIAPDQSYLIFASGFETGVDFQTRLYMSFRTEVGSWGEAIDLDDELGLTRSGYLCPIVSPDGGYLFLLGVFWVEANFIEALRPLR